MIRRLATTVLLLAIISGMSLAAERANNPHVLGSCSVVKTTSMGQNTQVELRVRIVNPGEQAVSVEKLTLLAPGPATPKPLPSPVQISAHSQQEITQEFKIPMHQYQLWQKGVRAFLIVGMRSDDGIRFHHMIRLNEKSPLRGD
jgi:hypothetical protein